MPECSLVPKSAPNTILIISCTHWIDEKRDKKLHHSQVVNSVLPIATLISILIYPHESIGILNMSNCILFIAQYTIRFSVCKEELT